MLLAHLETIEHARFRALAQLIVDSKKGIEAFEEYMKIAFPYLEASKKRDRDKYIDILKNEVFKGPMRVRSMRAPMAQSRMKKKVVAVNKRAQEQMDGLYKKMGDTIPR